MSNNNSYEKILVLLLLVVSITPTVTMNVSALPTVLTGKNFDHILIIAMENKYYSDVMGTNGQGNKDAPFLTGLLTQSSTVPSYHGYGITAKINGCSAGCYLAFTSGSDQNKDDGYCPHSSSPCLPVANIASELVGAGLSWKAYCEDTCSRSADHFPFIAYDNTWNICVKSNFQQCNGPNIYSSNSAMGNSQLITELNSPSPANYIWFTPSDSHNMHNNDVSSGDNYLRELLVGLDGTIQHPSPGSVLSTSLFTNPASRTLLYLWWDEYDPAPNLFYGSMIKSGYVSSHNDYDEYAALHMIEDNWNLPTLNHDKQAPIINDIFKPLTIPSPVPNPNPNPTSSHNNSTKDNCSLPFNICNISSNSLLPTIAIAIVAFLVTLTIVLTRKRHG
jgi:hypothetical protein